MKIPYLGEQDNRFYRIALSLISTGKNFALSGLSDAGKSTLIHYILSRLDVNCYKPSLVHYGGLQRIKDVLGIERVLTIGVHCPVELHLLLLKED